jgi:DNA-binding NarL/FixJ family response regulator
LIKLILADDHPVFISGLRAVFDAEDDLTVMSVATTGQEAVRAAIENQPDVAVLDLNMPDGDGLWVCGQLRAAGLATRALILTMYDDDENVLAALRAGAYGYTLKGSGPDEIVAAVRAVARGEALFGAGIAAQMLSHFSRTAATSPFPQLTEREHEVLGLLAAGRDNAAVARRLGVSSKTVRNHVSNIITKLHVADRSGAIIRARDAGMGGAAGSSWSTNSSVEPSDQIPEIAKPIVYRVLQDVWVEVGVLVRQHVSHCDNLWPIVRGFGVQELGTDSADGVDGHLYAMADCISDQNIVEPATPKVVIEYVKVLNRVL